MGFDVDSCAVGYDGKSVYVSPRAHHALTYRINTVDMTRRSPSYEMRLVKYCSRGFSVLIPSLDPERIDPMIFEKRFDQVQGLAKLLLLTKVEKQVFRFKYKEQRRLRKLRPKVQSNDVIATKFIDDEDYNAERLEGGAAASDYSTVFLPWGPKWDSARIRKLMYTKDMILNSKWYDPKKKYHTHPCFFGTIKEILKDCCGNCPPVPAADQDSDSSYVSGELTWVTVNPGQQTVVKRIGSFHPITEGDWTEGAYISVTTDDLFSAINANNLEKLNEILARESDINLEIRDASGRTALHLAVIVNAIECAAVLLKHGARISTRMLDGRTAVHLCAQYNSPEILKMIIERGAELEVIKSQKTQNFSADVDMVENDDTHDMIVDKEEDEDEKEEEEEEGDDEEEEEEEESDDDDEEVDAEFCLKAIIEKKKLGLKKELEENDDPPGATEGDDCLQIDIHDWDYQLSALEYAAFFGNNQVIEVLVKLGGADLKALSKNGLTIAMIAIVNGHVSTVDLLINLGHPVNHMDVNRRNALHFLSTLDIPSIPILDVLLNHGINVNATCNSRVSFIFILKIVLFLNPLQQNDDVLMMTIKMMTMITDDFK
jgi:ankyrin repeat protein